MSSMNGADAMVRMLQLNGVKHIFGLCGDTSLPFYDALARLDHGMDHVLTRDERTVFGRLDTEAPSSMTLRDAAGQAHTILRTDIKSMTAATSSLMPAGLDQTMSSGELADLIAYLKNVKR